MYAHQSIRQLEAAVLELVECMHEDRLNSDDMEVGTLVT
jgi:hypothetical protein